MRNVCFASIVLLAGATASIADQVTMGSGLYQTGQGGEFQVTPLSGNAGVTGLPADTNSSTFQTFCVQTSEHFGYGGPFDYTIGTETVGLTSTALAPEVAYLYTQFRNGTLGSYNYSGSKQRKTSAAALQSAIWYFMGGAGGSNNAFAQAAYEATHEGSDGQITWSGIGDVRVLRLFNGPFNNNGHNQDQLTIVAVSAPNAIILGLIGIGLTIWIKWQRL